MENQRENDKPNQSTKKNYNEIRRLDYKRSKSKRSHSKIILPDEPQIENPAQPGVVPVKPR
ncbi:hypothetical protein [Legionella cardiaca]|uniref:Uncharacterized protein n=1 Tax=Legionella cardiaca TaxID=1071983 RepID=A0ABY8AV21_9GAMM|nr:hypothetical protein [Legionella cardiaca]WED44006.1 hypothetical protein PXX05_04260 [Legionella cardiaca]